MNDAPLDSGSNRPALSLALAGGGTGGHVVPGLRVLERALADSTTRPSRVLWFLAGRAVEEAVLGGLPELLGDVPCTRQVLHLEPPGSGAPSRLRLVARLLPEILRARRAFARSESRVLLGLGGFTSLPAVLAARSLGIPIVLLEVNATAGGATRTLARCARHIVHAWEASLPPGGGFPGRHLRFGPPLSASAFATPGDEEEAAREREALGLSPTRPLVLVLGGSQGAASLNRFVREFGEELVASGLQLVHQTGPGRADEGGVAFDGYRALEYLEDVPRYLRAATLVLCRGGASTLAEVAAAARPAIVVPYPYSPDRHQEKNARELGDGVEIVDDADLNAACVARIVALAGSSAEACAERKRRALALANAVPRDGAERLAKLLASLAAE